MAPVEPAPPLVVKFLILRKFEGFVIKKTMNSKNDEEWVTSCIPKGCSKNVGPLPKQIMDISASYICQQLKNLHGTEE